MGLAVSGDRNAYFAVTIPQEHHKAGGREPSRGSCRSSVGPVTFDDPERSLAVTVSAGRKPLNIFVWYGVTVA